MNDNCAAMMALLVRAADETPSAEDEARLTAHLADCPSCRADLASQRTMRELLQGYADTGASLGFDRRVMAAVRAEAERRPGGWLNSLDFRRWTLRLVPVAAALALAAVMVSEQDSGTSQVAEPVSAALTDTTGADTLPVSAALWSDSVNESSLLSLMLTANADDRLSTYRKDQ